MRNRLSRREKRWEKNRQSIKLGDFVCISEPSAYQYNLGSSLAQAVGRVSNIDEVLGVMLLLPTRITRSMIPIRFRWDEIRKASAYEGMMAFWDPEEENRRFFAIPNATTIAAIEESRRMGAARDKAAQSEVKVEDF